LKTIVMLLLLVLSLAVGVAIGEWFFRLYLSAIPPVALSSFNTKSARMFHWGYGVGVGVVLFVWVLLGMAANRLFHMASRSAAKP
jgi:uncharacterized membrane protein